MIFHVYLVFTIRIQRAHATAVWRRLGNPSGSFHYFSRIHRQYGLRLLFHLQVFGAVMNFPKKFDLAHSAYDR